MGNTNNANFAPINDCTQFDYLIAVLEERDQNNFLISIDTFQEIMVGNLDEGFFMKTLRKSIF